MSKKRARLNAERETKDRHRPRLQAKLVLAWAELHRDDLRADWALVTGKGGVFSRDIPLPEAHTGEVTLSLTADLPRPLGT